MQVTGDDFLYMTVYMVVLEGFVDQLVWNGSVCVGQIKQDNSEVLPPFFASLIGCVMALVFLRSLRTQELLPSGLKSQYTKCESGKMSVVLQERRRIFPLDVEQRDCSELVDRFGILFLWCKYSFRLLPRGWNIPLPPDYFQEPP